MRIRTMRAMTGALILSSSIVALTAPALAQDTNEQRPQTRTTREQPADTGEILVVAQGREQLLNDVPIAVSAVSAATLQNSGVADVRQLNQLAPSLLVSGATSELAFSARIRGVGTVGENPGLESSVGLFIDGVYRSRTGVGLSELGDIERVEVLRGPQGTLAGRNSTAGMINIITRAPQFQFGGRASVTYGNYDYWRVDGAVTGPITETLAASFEATWMKRDGYIRNVSGGPDVNDRDRYLLRGQILWEPSDSVSFRLIGDYSRREEQCCGTTFGRPYRALSRGPNGQVNVTANPFMALMQALGANYQLSTNDDPFVLRQSITPGIDYHTNTKDWGLSGQLNWALNDTVNLTSITAYRDFRNTSGADADFTQLDILNRTDYNRNFRLFSQELRLQGRAFDDRLDWLIGGYYANERLNVSDDIKFGADYERFANCLVTASLLPGAVLPSNQYCVNVPVVQATISALPAGATRSLLQAYIANPNRPGYGSLAAALGQPNIQINNTGTVRNTFEQRSRNFAFFTHNVVQLVPDRLMLTLGARYTNERKTMESTVNNNSPLCRLIVNSPFQALAAAPCAINGTAIGFNEGAPGTRRSESEWTGTAVLSFKPIDSLMLYASASRGYKAGGFNLDTSALDRPCSTAFDAACAARLALPANMPNNGRPEASDLQFDAEKVTAFELGAKWDGRDIDVGFAAFYQSYNNFQLNTYNGVNFEVTNIASCKDNLNGGDRDGFANTGGCSSDRLRSGLVSRGFELEVHARPARYFNVNMGFTYSDTHFRNNLVGTNGRPLSPVLFQLPGHQMSNAPRYVVTGGLSWTPPIGNSGLTSLFYLDFRYQGDVNTGSDLDVEKEQDGVFLLNGRIGLYGQDRRWGIELWAQNILNTRYQQIAADAPLQGGGTWRAVAAPASSGLAATANQMFVNFPGEPRMYGVTLRTKF